MWSYCCVLIQVTNCKPCLDLHVFVGCYMPIQPPAKSLTSPWGLRSFSPCTDSSHKLLYEIFVNNILCLNKIFTWFGKTCIVHTSNFEHFKIYKSQRMDKELKWDRNGGPKALVSFKSRLFKVEKLDVWTVYACIFLEIWSHCNRLTNYQDTYFYWTYHCTHYENF